MKDGVRHFPGISVEAATLLANDRHVAAIGIDTPSIDYGMRSVSLTVYTVVTRPSDLAFARPRFVTRASWKPTPQA